MSEKRVFSEQEVAAILQRAIEVSEQEEPVYQPGITRDELFKIGADVGVSADAIQRVLREKESSKDPVPKNQLSLTFERVVDGELDPSQFDLIVEGLKPVQRQYGTSVSQVGRTLTMPTWNGFGQSMIELTARRGRTKIKVKSGTFMQGMMTLYPAFMASLFLTAIVGKAGSPVLGALVGLGTMLAGLGLFRWTSRRGHEKSRELADMLRDRVEDALAEARPPVVSPTVVDPQYQQNRLGG